MVDKYMAGFKDRFGYVNCRQLTGSDLNTKEGYRSTTLKSMAIPAQKIKFAVEKALEILKK